MLVAEIMALSETTNVSNTEKSTPETNKHEKREKPPTKVIVRRLPPSMTQDEFISQVSPIPDYDYIYAVKGDMSLGENAFSRVYINFIKSDDIYLFKEKFDNYVFVDGKGHEYAAVVEFASFQKIPKKRGKPRPDPKISTVETDPLYLEFIESLKQQPNQEEKPEFSYQPSSESKNEASTPLLDFIKQRKMDKLKSKEEKREERRKKEFERKKLREEERRKRFEEKSPTKNISVRSNPQIKPDINLIDKVSDTKAIKEEDVEKEKNIEKNEKSTEKAITNPHKSKDTKKLDGKYKPKYPPRSEKYDNYEKRDYKPRRDEYRDRDRRGRYDDHKKDDYKKEAEVKQYPKKVKKYSERREERKYEIRKAEQKKEDGGAAADIGKQDKEDENLRSSISESPIDNMVSEENKGESRGREELKRTSSKEGDDKSDDQDKLRNKENDPRVQRRIRNKDRPTMQIYQPGMLSKRRQQEDDKDMKESPIKE